MRVVTVRVAVRVRARAESACGWAAAVGIRPTEGQERFYATSVAGVVQASVARDARQCSLRAVASPRGMGGSAGFEPQRHLGGMRGSAGFEP